MQYALTLIALAILVLGAYYLIPNYFRLYLHRSLGELRNGRRYLHRRVGELRNGRRYLHRRVGEARDGRFHLHRRPGALRNGCHYLHRSVGEAFIMRKVIPFYFRRRESPRGFNA